MLLLAFNGKAPTASLPVNGTAFNLPGDSIIQRIVCFTFKAGTTKKEIAQHMRGFSAFKG